MTTLIYFSLLIMAVRSSKPFFLLTHHITPSQLNLLAACSSFSTHITVSLLMIDIPMFKTQCPIEKFVDYKRISLLGLKNRMAFPMASQNIKTVVFEDFYRHDHGTCFDKTE